MPNIRLGNVINRRGDFYWFAYNGPIPPVDTIDDIHRRIRDKGTFDKNDLNKIVIHYNTIDPKGIGENADNLNRLYRKLDAIGKFSNIVPEPNCQPNMGGEGPRAPSWATEDEYGFWYDPAVIYGTANNETHAGDLEGYIDVNRFDNEGFGRPDDTGYEIEFADDDGLPTITFRDVPKTP